MDHLAGRFRVLASDLYGSGRSPAWPQGRRLSLDDEIELLEPVFASAGDRFHVIGHSYGGGIALKASLLPPERIASLVLVEPVLFALLVAEDPEQPAAREIAAVRDATITAVERGDFARSAERFVDYWAGPGAWAGAAESRRGPIIRAMPKVAAEWHALFTEPTPLEAFAALEVETTLIAGSESPASSKRVAHLLERTLPRVTRVELPGVGHLAPVTHPDAVNAAIDAHLRRVLGGPPPWRGPPRELRHRVLEAEGATSSGES